MSYRKSLSHPGTPKHIELTKRHGKRVRTPGSVFGKGGYTYNGVKSEDIREVEIAQIPEALEISQKGGDENKMLQLRLVPRKQPSPSPKPEPMTRPLS
jgi:hypothetical protein